MLLTTKQSYDDIIKVLAEAQGRNQDLMHKVEDSDRKIVLLEASVKRFNLLLGFPHIIVYDCFPPIIILVLFAHRLEESTTDKDSLLAIEKHENNETKKELTGAQKRIEELLIEVQDTRANIAELEDSIRRFVTYTYRRITLLI